MLGIVDSFSNKWVPTNGCQQMGGILMGTNCVPLLVNLFLNFYENEFLDKLIEEGKRRLARKCNLSLH